MLDPGLFVAEPGLNAFVKRSTVAAPVEQVYAAWTDSDTFVRAYDPDNHLLRANIELRIGGRYEWLWDGATGSNDCHVLSFVPNRMLSFSWNAPPGQPESRALRIWVVVEFNAMEGAGTELTLTHLGFGSEPHWRETRDYFQSAWEVVLGRFRETHSRRLHNDAA